MATKAEQLMSLIRDMVAQRLDFHERRGPGVGDRYTHQFTTELATKAESLFGEDFSERDVHEGSDMRFDYLFLEEQTAVEVAWSLWSTPSEFDRDIFKCLIFNKENQSQGISKLIFVTKSPGGAVVGRPAPKAVIEYVKSECGLLVEVIEV